MRGVNAHRRRCIIGFFYYCYWKRLSATEGLIHLLYAFNLFTYTSCLFITPPLQTTHTQNSFQAWNNPPLSRCKTCKRLIGTTSNLSCRGKNIPDKYFSAFIKHLSSRLCLTEWQGSCSLWVCVVRFGPGGAAGVSLWGAGRRFPHVQWSQGQLAPDPPWPRLSPSVPVGVPLGWGI